MKQISLLFLFLFSLTTGAQTPFDSQSLIKYDILSHSTDKPIPFDAPFTLLLEKTSIKDVTHVYAYQAEFKNGVRSSVLGMYYDDNRNVIKDQPVYDVDLKFEEKNGSLYIYFGAIRPGILFDLIIETKLSEICTKELLKVNILLAEKKVRMGEINESEDLEAKEEMKAMKDQFAVLKSCTLDKTNMQTAFAMNWNDYQYFFKEKLEKEYLLLRNPAENGSAFSVLESSAVCQLVKDFGCDVLYETAKSGYFENICDGTANITTVFKDKKISIYDSDQRLLNLKTNQIFFEDLVKKLTLVEATGRSGISIGGTTIQTDKLRAKAIQIYEALNKNIKWIKLKIENRNSIIKENTKIREMAALTGNTVSSDLKSASGRVLFGDMGLSYIFVENLHGETAALPALHLGFSIYFRSIDKNTRYSRFRCSMYPKKVKIHEQDAETCMPGPDYEMMTRRNLLQHLSLSVGITVTSLTNSEFDNFYKSNSLLVGPAYRFYRGFKISSGASFLRRTSTNPLISEKKVIMGAYISLSVDIDFLSGIEKVTSIVFK